MKVRLPVGMPGLIHDQTGELWVKTKRTVGAAAPAGPFQSHPSTVYLSTTVQET